MKTHFEMPHLEPCHRQVGTVNVEKSLTMAFGQVGKFKEIAFPLRSKLSA